MDFKLSDWSLVITNGVWLVGKLDGRKLSPVFQLHTALLTDSETKKAQQPMAVTPFLGQGLRSLQIPEGAVIIGLENFPFRREWEAQILNALRQDERCRAAALGLVVQ